MQSINLYHERLYLTPRRTPCKTAIALSDIFKVYIKIQYVRLVLSSTTNKAACKDTFLTDWIPTASKSGKILKLKSQLS